MSKWKTLLSHGVHEVEEGELALMFLYRLYKTRYGQMIVDLANDALKGIPYPTTVMATYIMAANRQEYTASASSSTHTVYTLSEDKHSKYKPSSGKQTPLEEMGASVVGVVAVVTQTLDVPVEEVPEPK